MVLAQAYRSFVPEIDKPIMLMTLKELLTQVGFDELLPYLKKHEPKHLDNIYAFREAYDILRGMEPAKDFEGKIFVEWHGGEFEGEEKWIGVGSMHDSSWEEDLAKDIAIANDVHLSPEELTMHCLWEITYWGFSPAERQETWRQKFGPKTLTNPYEVALDRLEESIWRHQTPRRLRSKGKDGRRYVRWTNARDFFNGRKNRSKRKREYRQDKREEYLRKMAARENLVRMLSAEGSSFRRRDVDFLLGIEYGTRYDYHSVVHDTASRLAYILESMTKYQQLDLTKYDNAIVFVHYHSRSPLVGTELEMFHRSVMRHLGYSDMLFGAMTEDNDNEEREVKVTLLLNKR